eukprot:349788_1
MEDFAFATWNRHKIWLKIGNSANAVNDLVSLGDMKIDERYREMSADKMAKLVDLGVCRHPSQFMTSQIMNKRDNKACLKLNKFSIDGWHLLDSKHKRLSKRHGHVMIEHDGSLYVFGGTCVEFGEVMFSTEYQRTMDDRLCFVRINIDFDTKTYVYKTLLFPNQIKYCLIGKQILKTMSWKRMVTGQKWKNKMVIFGGYNNPFRNVLIYNFDTQNWKTLNVKNMPKCLNKCNSMTKHCAVIMNDIMYVFGGKYNGNETNLFCSLNLITKKW